MRRPVLFLLILCAAGAAEGPTPEQVAEAVRTLDGDPRDGYLSRFELRSREDPDEKKAQEGAGPEKAPPAGK